MTTGLIPKMGTFVKRRSPQLGTRPPCAYAGMIPVMGNKLRELRLRRGWTLEQAAAEFGMSTGGYHKVERSERKLTVERLTKAAGIYSVSISNITDESESQKIVGTVNSLGVVSFYDQPGEIVPAPKTPDASKDSSALTVTGGAIPGLADEHWLVYYQDIVEGMPPERVGELCVVSLEGGVVVKLGRIYNGTNPATFDVVTPGQKPLKDAAITWSAIVSWIKPR